MDLWAYQNEMEIDFTRPGKPTDNAFVEGVQRNPLEPSA
jgi:putative transposase